MKTILVLAGEAIVRGIFRYMLKEYHVIAAANAEEAIILLRTHLIQFDLLLADMVLPKVSGAQVALLFRIQDPTLPVILTSDYSPTDLPSPDRWDLERLGPSGMLFLKKPFRTEALLSAVGELIGVPQPEMSKRPYQQAG